jgi:hypothetical protein
MRYDRAEIDRQSMRRYKANLGVITSRYGDLEQRVLVLFGRDPKANTIDLPGGLDILLMHLLEDGMLVHGARLAGIEIMGIPQVRRYELTPAGRDFVQHWFSADIELN